MLLRTCSTDRYDYKERVIRVHSHQICLCSLVQHSI